MRSLRRGPCSLPFSPARHSSPSAPPARTEQRHECPAAPTATTATARGGVDCVGLSFECVLDSPKLTRRRNLSLTSTIQYSRTAWLRCVARGCYRTRRLRREVRRRCAPCSQGLMLTGPSADVDVQIAGPALCLFFSALGAQGDPPTIAAPDRSFELTSGNCPPSFASFFKLWQQSVRPIKKLSSEARHDLALLLCDKEPVSSPLRTDVIRLASDLKAVSLEITQVSSLASVGRVRGAEL